MTGVTLDEICEAARGLIGVAVRTPLLFVPALSEQTNVAVHLKLENRQPTGAFKVRGAWTAMRRLAPEQLARGVVTYSSGNHGQAVAFAAQRLGARAVVVMPQTAPRTKVDGVRRWSGEVVFAGTTSEDRYRRAIALADLHGLAVIPPFDHPDIIAGQGTVGLEILEDLPEVQHVVAPVGGGGLAAGVAAALSGHPGVRLTGVEPEGAASLTAALHAGHPVRLSHTASVADGLLPLSVGTITFNHLRERADAVTVAETAIVDATKWLHAELHLAVEPSGAVTTAAVRCGALQLTGPTVLIVSGGNVDADELDQLTAG